MPTHSNPRRWRSFTIVLSTVMLMILATGTPASATRARSPKASFGGGARATSVPGEVVVRYRAGADSRPARARVNATGRRRMSVAHTEVLRLSRGASVSAAIDALRADPAVVYAEPNYIRHLALTPNDPGFPDQWGLHNTGQPSGTIGDDIHAPEAWDLTTGADTLIVAVLDSGMAYDHPDLAPNVWVNSAEFGDGKESNGLDDDGNGFIDDWRGWDFVSNDNDPRDFNGHGTHVAGIIGAVGNDGAGVAGVTWTSQLMPVRIADGDGVVTSSNLANSFTYAAHNGAKIVNGSFGGGAPSQAELDAIKGAPGTLFVFAAGNDKVNNDVEGTYPCDYGADRELTNVMCVAATDRNDVIAPFSNYGANSVDIAAPGVEVTSTWPAFGAPVLSDAFDTDLAGRWVSGGTNSTWGLATINGATTLADSPVGNYADNTASWIRTANPIDLSGEQGCTFSAAILADLESAVDVLSIQAARTPDGPWTTLLSGADSTGGEFESAIASLSVFDGAATYLRFLFESDDSVTRDGVFIDDVSVKCLSSTYTGNEFMIDSGTSMATPLVSGAAALLFAQDPLRTPARVRAILLANVDARSGLSSRVLSGGRLNIDRALRGVVPTDLSAPTAGVAMFSMPFRMSNVFGAAWSGADTGRGVAVTTVRVRAARTVGIFGPYGIWRDWGTARSANFSGSAGTTYCFSARARDRSANYSAWSAERCEAVPVNDRSLTASGFTRKVASDTLFRTYSEATKKGATLRIGNVRYRRMVLIATRCPRCGLVEVLAGSVVLARISLSASTRRAEQIFAVSTRSSLSGATTITIRTTTSGKPVRIEGLGIGAA